MYREGCIRYCIDRTIMLVDDEVKRECLMLAATWMPKASTLPDLGDVCFTSIVP